MCALHAKLPHTKKIYEACIHFFIFHQMIALKYLRKMLFISFRELNFHCQDIQMFVFCLSLFFLSAIALDND